MGPMGRRREGSGPPLDQEKISRILGSKCRTLAPGETPLQAYMAMRAGETPPESPHTPGEWVPIPPPKKGKRWMVGARGPLGGKGAAGRAAATWWVATVENGAPGDTLETEAANARLIAASKVLLAACKTALPHLVNESAADAVRAAIVAAE